MSNNSKRKSNDEPIASIVETAPHGELPKSIEDFDDMEFLSPEILSSIYEYGFKYPSPVQARSIHIINSKNDTIVQSDSGTGKTGAFVIGMLSLIDPQIKTPQAIMIANSRPLAGQIMRVVERLSSKLDITVCLCVGGGTMRSDENAEIAKRSQILIGTPGRLRDISTKKKPVFMPNDIKILIMDEADELLKDDQHKGGFRADIRDIVNQISKTTQICMFSATYSESSYSLAKKIMNDPYEIVIQQEQLSTDRILQFKIEVSASSNYRNYKRQMDECEQYKIKILIDLANRLTLNQAIIFTNNKNTAFKIRDGLYQNGFESIGMISSETDAESREKTLCQFRLTQIKFLISTDLISRGIDIDDLRCVINFDFPKSTESYIHRVGRTGRYGGQGVAINFVTQSHSRRQGDDMDILYQLSRQYSIDIGDMPSIEEVNEILTGFSPPTNKASSSQNYSLDP